MFFSLFFNKIAGRNIEINGKSYSILQMFQYYNLLKFRGRGGRNSLTSIFEDVMGDEKLKSYRSFVNNFDKTFDLVHIYHINPDIYSIF